MQNFSQKQGFTLFEVMISSALLFFLLFGFSRIVEQTLNQTRLRNQKAQLASHLDYWTNEITSQPLNNGTSKKEINWKQNEANLGWTVEELGNGLKAIQFEVSSKDQIPVVLMKWKTAVRDP